MPLHPPYEGLKEDNKKVSQVLMQGLLLLRESDKMSIQKRNHKMYVENKYIITFFATSLAKGMRHINANFLILVLLWD